MRPLPSPRIIAHRGASHDAPENTLAAFRLAWDQGADGIETDCRLTKDGEVVCLHDATTGRTANRDMEVASSSLADLRALDFGSWKHPRFAGERLPTLAEALAAVPKGKLVFIEIKGGPEILPVLTARLHASGLDPTQVVILGFDAGVIAACKRALPALKAHLLTGYSRSKDHPESLPSPTAHELAATLRTCAADGLGTHADREAATPAFLQVLREGGMREFAAWTVDDAATGRHFRDLGAMAITTNRPREMREWLGQGATATGRA